MDKTLYIGLMSGTSMDGVDAVLVDFSPSKPEVLGSLCYPMPDLLKQNLKQMIDPDWQGSLYEIGVIDQQLGKLFADAVQQLLTDSHIAAQQINAVGSHGQTVWHQPTGEHPFTLQFGDPTHIAEQCKITTVADFRRMDMAASGQGAPLVPAFHQQVLSHASKNRVIVNIGGIANLTVLPAQNRQHKYPITGYDTGPGNGLMDAWIQKHRNSTYDKNGNWGRNGQINDEMLLRCLRDEPYYSLMFPKSTGKEYFNLTAIETLYPHLHSLKPIDVQATLTELTASTIGQEILLLSSSFESLDEIYICGGGSHNQFLMERLQSYLPHISIQSTSTLGINPDWVEAIAFAWLAKQTIQGKSGNLPSATGAKGERILGAIHQSC
jgi:anhydro-N-acetylmuramic acid kinase